MVGAFDGSSFVRVLVQCLILVVAIASRTAHSACEEGGLSGLFQALMSDDQADEITVGGLYWRSQDQYVGFGAS